MAKLAKRQQASDFFAAGSESDSDHSSEEPRKQDYFGLDDDDAHESDGSEEEEERGISKGRSVSSKVAEDDENASSDEDSEDKYQESDQDMSDGDESGNDNPATVKPLSEKEIEKNLKKIKKSGVVYISRVPPFMKPTKMRQILSRFGEVNRIFLAPEDPKAYARRVKYGGNKKKNYVEGWAEFTKKKHAKLAAEMLNGNIIGGKKGNYYHDDIMNIKYLPKFKWHHLTEQIAVEAQSRHEKMRAEIAQATIENRTFMDNVQKNKMIEGIKKKRGDTQETEDVRRTFTQREVSSARAGESKKPAKTSNTSVLSKVF